jgi:phospholipid/cholesterol/gamma-HCH transport system substrate-binding protein
MSLHPIKRLRSSGRRVGAPVAALSVAVLASSCGLSLQSLPKLGGVSGPTYGVTATFANVVNLPANAQVGLGAFSVGYVSSIGLKDFQAVVSMRVKTSVKLPLGTTAAIQFDTPLGEDYVLLEPPAPTPVGTQYLTNGSAIPESETNTAPSVEDAFAALGALLNGGGIDQLQTIITQTNLALDGNQTQIRQLLESLNATVTSFANNTPAVDGALAAMASLSKVLNQGRNTITNGIATLGPAVAVLGQENQNLANLLAQLNTLSASANNIIEQSATGTVATLKGLQALIGQLLGVQQQLGPALDAVNSFETNTPKVAPGDYAQLAIQSTIEVPPVPSDAPPLQKVTVDPPESEQSYDRSAIATLIEGGLP